MSHNTLGTDNVTQIACPYSSSWTWSHARHAYLAVVKRPPVHHLKAQLRVLRVSVLDQHPAST
eukprot:39523-Chlamydomonas_euryale.AAC.1